jgi:hypothetical protein
MSGSHYTPQEFIDKVDYEGGLYDAVVGYGLDDDDLDPEVATPEQIAALKEFCALAKRLSQVEAQVENLFPAAGSGDYDEEY